MALVQVGIYAKRNMETGEFGPAMPICKEVGEDTNATRVFESAQRDLEKYLANKVREYIKKTKMEEN